MGLELAAAVGALTLTGLWVDYKFGTGRKGVITGAVLGIVGGLYNFIRQALAMIREDQTQRTGERNHGDHNADTTRPR